MIEALAMTSPRQSLRLLEHLHQNFVMGRRAQVLAQRLAELLPPHARVLDVGCGDGVVAQLILQSRPDVQIEGVTELVVEPNTNCFLVFTFRIGTSELISNSTELGVG